VKKPSFFASLRFAHHKIEKSWMLVDENNGKYPIYFEDRLTDVFPAFSEIRTPCFSGAAH